MIPEILVGAGAICGLIIGVMFNYTNEFLRHRKHKYKFRKYLVQTSALYNPYDWD